MARQQNQNTAWSEAVVERNGDLLPQLLPDTYVPLRRGVGGAVDVPHVERQSYPPHDRGNGVILLVDRRDRSRDEQPVDDQGHDAVPVTAGVHVPASRYDGGHRTGDRRRLPGHLPVPVEQRDSLTDPFRPGILRVVFEKSRKLPAATGNVPRVV